MVIHMQQKKENDNIMNYDTVRLDDENNAIIIIDQTKLPGSIELIALKTAEEIWDAIYLLRVRGAPAIGVAAAFGIYLLAKQSSAGIIVLQRRKPCFCCTGIQTVRSEKNSGVFS